MQPIDSRLACTGSAMSGSATCDRSHAPSSTTWVSIPRWQSAAIISTPSGVASSTTAFLTSFSVSLSSIPRRMFLT